MRNMRDILNALMVALISIGLMVGALSISLVEFVPGPVPTLTNNLLPSPEPLTATATFPPTPIPTFSLQSATPSLTPIFTSTAMPTLACQPPFGWTVQINIQIGDTLASIAARYRISTDALRNANCLLSDNLIPGSRLYVPPAPTSTFAVCIPGAIGWVNNYIVQPGDSLYRIGYNHYTTLELMRLVNCRSSDTIYPGDRLWVPGVATRTPIPTPTVILPATATPTPTPTNEPPATSTPTSTPTPTTEPTATPTPTETPVPPVPPVP